MARVDSKGIVWAAVVGLMGLGLIGCHSEGDAKGGMTKEDLAALEKRNGADPTRAAAFVKQMAAVPFAQRIQYAQQHREEMQNLSKVPDPEIQAQFKALMVGRG